MTTLKEKPEEISLNLLYVEELGSDFLLAKEKILSRRYVEEEEPLVIGVDPGVRIGFVVYYKNKEIESCILRTIDETVDRIILLVENAEGQKIVRIGEGSLELSKRLASTVESRLGNKVILELVDERGTSSLSRTKFKNGGTRHERSARLIAFRRGRIYSNHYERVTYN